MMTRRKLFQVAAAITGSHFLSLLRNAGPTAIAYSRTKGYKTPSYIEPENESGKIQRHLYIRGMMPQWIPDTITLTVPATRRFTESLDFHPELAMERIIPQNRDGQRFMTVWYDAPTYFINGSPSNHPEHHGVVIPAFMEEGDTEEAITGQLQTALDELEVNNFW